MLVSGQPHLLAALSDVTECTSQTGAGRAGTSSIVDRVVLWCYVQALCCASEARCHVTCDRAGTKKNKTTHTRVRAVCICVSLDFPEPSAGIPGDLRGDVSGLLPAQTTAPLTAIRCLTINN